MDSGNKKEIPADDPKRKLSWAEQEAKIIWMLYKAMTVKTDKGMVTNLG